MNCDEARSLVDAFLDGELDLARQLEVEAHLAECVTCVRTFETRRALQSALRASDLYVRAPDRLARQIGRQVAPPRRLAIPARGWLVFAAAAVLVLTTAALMLLRTGQVAADGLAQQVISAHVRSLQPGHLADVDSSDQHTVKPWFAGKVDFSPPVVDLRQRDFPLVGGRLDSVNGHTVAALVYRRRQHIVNVFIWPSNGESAPQSVRLQGYNVIRWTGGGFTHWAVSDLDDAELNLLVGLLRRPA